jgi:hypothetical protein
VLQKKKVTITFMAEGVETHLIELELRLQVSRQLARMPQHWLNYSPQISGSLEPLAV